MKYDPANEIGKLQKPVLIVQGTTDIQITMEDANRLSQGNPKATKSVIDGMNHVFKEAPMDRMANIQTYMQPDLPLVPELVDSVTQFINAQ